MATSSSLGSATSDDSSASGSTSGRGAWSAASRSTSSIDSPAALQMRASRDSDMSFCPNSRLMLDSLMPMRCASTA